jgi:hypothetical protein
MGLEPTTGGTPDTARTKEFGKCAGCALIATCPTGPNGNPRSLVVLTVAGQEAGGADEKCDNFVIPGEEKPRVEGAESTLQ